jgi:hypothetical protein
MYNLNLIRQDIIMQITLVHAFLFLQGKIQQS